MLRMAKGGLGRRATRQRATRGLLDVLSVLEPAAECLPSRHPQHAPVESPNNPARIPQLCYTTPILMPFGISAITE
jgi:hypothetical protein